LHTPPYGGSQCWGLGLAGPLRGRPSPSSPGGAPAAVRAAARTILDDAAARDRVPLVLDYLALVDPADFTEIPDDRESGEAILAVAARVGNTRLIDNIPLTFGALT
uniref:pantoate--beta-alanine ligase n=1 Tax=Streptomyces sp. CC216C TaxID=3044576 RepID=UPI0024A84476